MRNCLQQIPIARPLHFCTLKIHKFKYPKLILVHLVLRQAAGRSTFLENLPHLSAGLKVTMGVLCHQLAFICILCLDAT